MNKYMHKFIFDEVQENLKELAYNGQKDAIMFANNQPEKSELAQNIKVGKSFCFWVFI